MLKHLSIKNYALIRDLSIDFSPGFTIITGETGAGKSILLGALGLLLGNRADPGVLMDKQKKCIVEGTFEISKLALETFFEANDLDFEPQSILRREIIPSGRSRAFINDSPVNLEVLRELGERLVDIHSQHQTLMLNSAQFQLDVLDSFVNQPELLQDYRTAFRQYDRNRRLLEELENRSQAAKQDQDYIRFQYNELVAAGLNVEETGALIDKEKLLSHAEEVLRELSHAGKLLSEAETSAMEQIIEAANALRRISGFFGLAGQLHERLEQLLIELKDIAEETDRSLADVSYDPAELQQITEKLDNVYRLQQKYGVKSVAELIAVRDGFRSRLDSSVTLEEEIELLKQQLGKMESEMQKLAGKLHRSRKSNLTSFSDAITGILSSLGMKGAAFEVRLEKNDNFNENGSDKVRFLFNANKGGSPHEIAKIASGGELSRLMLAVKSLVSRESLLPTVVFDEIDSGVSGEVAGKVGNILKKMSKKHQLIVISHLPQIASKAQVHLKVSKVFRHEKSCTEIHMLDTDGRVDEIAKMMSDEKVSSSALETARELLNQRS